MEKIRKNFSLTVENQSLQNPLKIFSFSLKTRQRKQKNDSSEGNPKVPLTSGLEVKWSTVLHTPYSLVPYSVKNKSVNKAGLQVI